MASRDTQAPARLMVRLEAGTGAAERLSVLLAAAPIASVVIAASAGHPLTGAQVSPLVAAGQKAGVAMLIEGDMQLAASSGADGVHLPCSETLAEGYAAARALLGARAIVGADAGRSRHDAMTLGEDGADYVAFGIPALVGNRDDAFDHQLELIDWWAELFEIPCVAMAGTNVDAASELAAAGADFVCMSCSRGLSLAELDAQVRSWEAAISVDRASPPAV